MPKRTNEFQRVILLARTHLAAGATVTESRMLRDNITGTEREVDICVEGELAGDLVTISIECRDQGRKCDVKWIEEMKAKHERLPTNLLILVSSSGFSQEAEDVAKTYGIKLITLRELHSSSGDRLFGSISSLWSKVFTLTPSKVVIRVATAGILPAENVVVLADNLVYDHQSNQIGTVEDVVKMLLHLDAAVKEFALQGNENHKGFEIRWEPVEDAAGNTLCLQKLDPLILRPIEYVHISGSCDFTITEFPIKEGKLGDVKIVWGKGMFLGQNSLLVATEDQAGRKVSIASEP